MRHVLLGLALVLLMAQAVAFAPPAQAAASDVTTVRRFDVADRVAALTFDAGSDRGYTVEILNTLSARGIKATFGMTGLWAQANPDLLQRIVADGHTLMNHSWDHPSFPSLSSAARRDQLKRTEDIVRQITGAELRPYFRPPFGAYDEATLADVAAAGYTWNIMWSIDTLGWQGLSAAAITERVINGMAPGGIVLMHVGAASQDAAALPGMIDRLEAMGYSFATVQEFVEGNIATERYFPETGFTVSGNFLRFWNRFGGLPVFGYPISPPFEEDGMLVQYFERNRFELQPGVWPEHYDVLLGRLGAELTAGRENEPPFRPVSATSDAACTWYAETGHRLCSGFRDWWWAHGGLTIFGFPISEEFVEDGRIVQYFERARFAWYPENTPPWNVLLSHFGRQALDARGGAPH